MIDRRVFMVQAAALPLAWRAQDAAVIDAALKRAKETGRWAVVLVAPAEARARFAFGSALWALTEFKADVEAQDLFCQAVFAVVMPEVAKGRFDGNRALYGPDGKLLASDRVGPGVYASGRAFGMSFRPFIHGLKGERLAERARALRPKDGAMPATIEGLTPWVASLGTPEAQARLLAYYAALPPDAPGARVPYGCSGPEEDTCESCGMAEVDERSHRFLRVLTGNRPYED